MFSPCFSALFKLFFLSPLVSFFSSSGDSVRFKSCMLLVTVVPVSEGSGSLGLLPILLYEGVGGGESSALGVPRRCSRKCSLPESS